MKLQDFKLDDLKNYQKALRHHLVESINKNNLNFSFEEIFKSNSDQLTNKLIHCAKKAMDQFYAEDDKMIRKALVESRPTLYPILYISKKSLIRKAVQYYYNALTKDQQA